MDRATLNATAPILRDFLVYSETIKGKATKTIEQYYLDLTLFFKFLKLQRGLVSEGTDFSDIIVNDIAEKATKKVLTLMEAERYRVARTYFIIDEICKLNFKNKE